MGFKLTEEQQAVVENRGGGLLVSAAAGSGKTRVLVERLLAQVCDEGRDIDTFLVITFTNAAAAELRGRIVEELGQRLAQAPGDRHLRRQTTLVYKTQISTIHAFCTSLLRECGHLVDLDPDFRLCDDSEGSILRLSSLDEVMDARYEALSPEDDFAQLLDMMSAGRDDNRLMQIALDIFGKIQSHPHPLAWLELQEQRFLLDGVTDAGETVWGRLLLDRAGQQCAHFARKLRALLVTMDQEPSLSKAYGPSVTETLLSLETLEVALTHGWEEAGQVEIVFPRLGSVRNCPDPALQAQVKSVRDQCKKRLEKVKALLADSSAELLGDLRLIYPAIRGLFALVRDFGSAYQKEKTRRGVVDFSDLEHLVVALLVGEDEAPTPLAHQLSSRYHEIMVDEYQDTNEVQNAIFTALSQAGHNLFMVGDVKQSIYRFRLADPGIFLEKYRTFPFYTQAAPGENRKIVLSQNFRSRPQVLEGVNYVFRNLMSTDLGEMEYGAEEALRPGGAWDDTAGDYRVELSALNLDNLEDGGEGKTDKNLIEARCTARRMGELLGSPVQSDGGTRPARPSDMVVLLRSPGPVLHHYARALSEVGIPWEAEGGGAFFDTTEISVALSLLQIVDNPRQDVPLISVLRSPVYGFSADRLAQIRAACPDGDFYAALTADPGADSCSFLEELAQLRFDAADKRSYELLWDIYERTNLLGLFSAMEGGEERRGNLLALYQHARRFESGGHKGLFGFLSHLNRLRENGAPLTAPHTSAGVGVKILSIHRSKGLEYPIVFLCGLSRRLNREDSQKPMLFHPKLGVGPKFLDTARMVEYPTLARRAVALQVDYEMMAEELRLLYVAMTRAKEKLVMTCTVALGGRELARLAEDATCPVAPQALAGALSVGQWLLTAALCRPEAQELRDAADVPLLSADGDFGPPWRIRYLEATDYEVPNVPPVLPTASPAAAQAPFPDLSARLSWVYPHPVATETPSKLTATQLKGRDLDQELLENTDPSGDGAEPSTPGRPPISFHRPRFAEEELGLTPAEQGTALHLVLQYIDFQKTGSLAEIEGEISRLVAQAFLSPAQGDAVAAGRLFAFFSSPLGREVTSSPTLQREFKFSVLEPAGRYYSGLHGDETVLLQGVVDCFYETAEGITVLDFKTDRVSEQSAPDRALGYAPQLAAYAQALEAITGRPVCRRILWFFALDHEIMV